MSVVEKIYYTWLILVIPISLCGWIFLDDDDSEEKHPILINFMCAFICLPIAIGLVAIFVWIIMQVWRG